MIISISYDKRLSYSSSGVTQHTRRVESLQARQPCLESIPYNVLEVVVQRVQVPEPQSLGDGSCRSGCPPGSGRQYAGCWRSASGTSPNTWRISVCRFQIELIAVITETLAIVDGLSRADTQQDVVRMMVAVRQVVDIVGGHERHVEVARDRHQPLVDDELFVDALILHLQEEIPGAEDVAKRRRRVERLPFASGSNLARDLSLQAAAQSNEPFRVLREQFFVDARLVVETFGVSCGDELDEVVVALVGFGQQDQVVCRLTYRAGLCEPAAGRDIHLATEDWFHTTLLRMIVKDHRREHVAVFGDRERRHFQPGRLIEKLVDAAGTVEQVKTRCEDEGERNFDQPLD